MNVPRNYLLAVLTLQKLTGVLNRTHKQVLYILWKPMWAHFGQSMEGSSGPLKEYN